MPAQFIFATLSGGINAWAPNTGSTAIVVKFVSGHSYMGLTLGSNASGNLLYAADFANGKIDVFDKDFNLSSVSGNFIDATVPANFHPYNIQNLGGALYVTYAEFSHFHDNDFGFVRKFDTNGVRDTGFAINNGPLAEPWEWPSLRQTSEVSVTSSWLEMRARWESTPRALTLSIRRPVIYSAAWLTRAEHLSR